MDVHDKLDEIAAVIESARAMPMSASCVVNRTEVLALLDELRALLPRELSHARAVLGDRAAVVEDGRREAEELLERARAERARLVDQTDVVGAAAVEAERLLEQARSESEAMRRQVDDYVDGKLANFEVVLHRTLTAVAKGRDKLRGRSELDHLDPAQAGGRAPAGHGGPPAPHGSVAVAGSEERLAATG